MTCRAQVRPPRAEGAPEGGVPHVPIMIDGDPYETFKRRARRHRPGCLAVLTTIGFTLAGLAVGFLWGAGS